MSYLVKGKRVTLDTVRKLTRRAKRELWEAAQSLERYPKVYLHWSAGHYGQFYDGYHINIDADGGVYVTTEDFAQVLWHTWKRNSGAVGIALACCADCTPDDFGEAPPTVQQIEAMAQVIAVMCQELEIPIDLCHVLTHAEAADCLDDPQNPIHELYGPDNGCERWDLWCFPGVECGQGGDVLRGKAIWYQQQGI